MDLFAITTNTLQAIEEASDRQVLESIRVQVFGKKGWLEGYFSKLPALPPDQRSQLGQELNQIKQRIQTGLEERGHILAQAAWEEQFVQEALDISLPGRGYPSGSLHPVTRTYQRVEAFFSRAGFLITHGPEIESDYYNFIALNIPENHPARALHDTFYLSETLLLRTHTSPVQIRVLETSSPPIRMISLGRVYRRDLDPTHTPMFHQLEGLVIDQTANFAKLKGLLENFLKVFFENEVLTIRFRPAYFPFTEPSAEVDVGCVLCLGQGCKTCKQTGWLEILGCGMVHPKVLQGVQLDPDRYQGYAFGVGIDRLSLLRYRIPDLRIMFENDDRFLKQF